MRKYCVFTIKVPLESQNEQTAAEGLRVTVQGSGLPAFLRVFRACNIKVSKRLQRGVGYGVHERFDCIFTGVPSKRKKSEQTAAEGHGSWLPLAVGLHFYSAPWPLKAKMGKRLQRGCGLR